MAPTATRRPRNCYKPREVGRVDSSSSMGSSMQLPCSSHINGSINNIGGSSSSSNYNSSPCRGSIEDDKEVLQTRSGCSTPKGQRFRIAKILSCPPAPMKPRVAPKFLSRTSSSAVTFFNPPDIDLFFFLAFRNVSA
ncbi:hypothetical protein PTKIN_Ptkin13bG0217200 [Pterospermum kingtungense]